MRKNKGSIDGDLLIIIVLILMFLGFGGFGLFKFIFARTAGNKTALDLNYSYDKAIVYVNGKEIELDIDTWSDYEGEQIQIITKDGTVYLVSSFNTILIGK